MYGLNSSWVIQDKEKSKYDVIFESLGPVGGKLSGDKVRPVLLNSKLPMDVLGKVWELSDIDKDGFLDKEEFSIAMYLVYRAIDNEPVPSVLPTNLIPSTKKTSSPSISSVVDHIMPGAVPVLPPLTGKSVSRHGSTSSNNVVSPKHSATQIPSQWMVSPADRSRFITIFQQNKDQSDNMISGSVARNVFVQSGLPQNILARVWSMCDQRQVGSLSLDQFVLAMHLISQKVKGIDLPNQVTAEMLSGSGHDSGFGDSGSLSDASSNVGDSATMRELDALTQEIEELRREKESLTSEILQKELAIKTTGLEVQGLQDTLDRDSSSLAQLECDKVEARTRLDELEQQKSKLDTMLSDVRGKVKDEEENIKSLRAQISAQEASVTQQEVELRRIKQQLSDLQKEQTQLEQRLEAGRQQQITVERSVKETETEMEKVQSQLLALKSQRKSVSSNIEQYGKAAAALKSQVHEGLSFPLQNVPAADPVMAASDSVFSLSGMAENVEEIKKDLSEDPFSVDPFHNSTQPEKSDPFGDCDPFSSNASAFTKPSDPFGGKDPFASTPADQADPFKASDSSFGFSAGNFEKSQPSSDPFGGQDPFAASNSGARKSPVFADDPFAPSDTSSSAKSTFGTSSGTKVSTDPTFGSSSFVATFPSGGSSSMIINSPSTDQQNQPADVDPWGEAFGGSTGGGASDPFGGDAFGSDPFVKTSFGQFDPQPNPQTNSPPKHPTAVGDISKPKQDSLLSSEAEQMAWAKEESRQAEEERRRKQLQEEADFELALRLSKQEG